MNPEPTIREIAEEGLEHHRWTLVRSERHAGYEKRCLRCRIIDCADRLRYEAIIAALDDAKEASTVTDDGTVVQVRLVRDPRPDQDTTA